MFVHLGNFCPVLRTYVLPVYILYIMDQFIATIGEEVTDAEEGQYPTDPDRTRTDPLL
jgi:hypothetical protein